MDIITRIIISMALFGGCSFFVLVVYIAVTWLAEKIITKIKRIPNIEQRLKRLEEK